MSQGGLERAAEQLNPEQFIVIGPFCREAEPSLRTRKQFPISVPSSDEQPATETEREEANSGTYNLRAREQNTLTYGLLTDARKKCAKTGNTGNKTCTSYLRRVGLSGAAVCVRNMPFCKTGVSTALLTDN